MLDVGCGRREFLELLKARGVGARGLDLNHEMVEVCRARGLDVAEADVVSYLEGLPDASLGGLFAAQVVEHLQPEYLLRFLELAHHKLRPGAPIVLETLNPACWVAFFDSFIRDITHVWPLHPDTLRYLVLASGFTTARLEYRSPVPAHDKLQALAAADAASPRSRRRSTRTSRRSTRGCSPSRLRHRRDQRLIGAMPLFSRVGRPLSASSPGSRSIASSRRTRRIAARWTSAPRTVLTGASRRVGLDIRPGAGGGSSATRRRRHPRRRVRGRAVHGGAEHLPERRRRSTRSSASSSRAALRSRRLPVSIHDAARLLPLHQIRLRHRCGGSRSSSCGKRPAPWARSRCSCSDGHAGETLGWTRPRAVARRRAGARPFAFLITRDAATAGGARPNGERLPRRLPEAGLDELADARRRRRFAAAGTLAHARCVASARAR